VVLVGPYEHHSNELPWLESIADVIEVDLNDEGTVDLEDLDRKLQAHAERPLRIGTFSAASNVTGVLTDVHGIARLLHRHGALAFFDYAAAGPYVPIDMHPGNPEERIDALFLSPHKFIGGPEASGVLVAHRSLFRTRTPERPGGGTVDYVAGPTRADVDYVESLAEREEGGTPAILGDIRAGLAFLVKGWIGPEVILRHEVDIAERVARRLERHPRIQVLGPTGPERLAIVPVSIDGLHHDLASALLDHLFGIQNRAGCSCAGPYGHRLLGIGPERSALFRAWVQRGINGIKPGWARLSVPHYASEEDLEFILSAVEFVADHGLDFVPLYRLNWRDGVWRPHDLPQADGLPVRLDRAALLAAMRPAAPVDTLDEDRVREERAGYLREAAARAGELRARWAAEEPLWNPSTGHADLDRLIWFRYVHQEGLPDPAPPGDLR
jgi:selenocysteine lyase/cysteine desulfurase